MIEMVGKLFYPGRRNVKPDIATYEKIQELDFSEA
jgi:hypothetical protein